MRAWTIEPVTSAEQIEEVLAIEEASFTNPWTRAMYLTELENTGVSYCFLAKDESSAHERRPKAQRYPYDRIQERHHVAACQMIVHRVPLC